MTMFSELLNTLRSSSSRCSDVKWRRTQLTGLLRLINEQQPLLTEALYKDLRRPYMEAVMMETATIKAEIVEALNSLDEWMRPVKVQKNLLTTLDTAFVQSQPLGVVLVIGAWNYPFQVTLLPLIGALAAGNAVVVKPSDISHHSSQLMHQLLPQYLDNECVKVVMGGVTETTELLKEKFDHIFYTGSTTVGRIIYKAAAENLTPVTLELGGKSPVVVEKGSDLKLVAKRLMWGKLSNAGQTCICPDYVLADKDIITPLIEECSRAIDTFHDGNSKSTKDFSRIINHHHFNRLKKLLDSTTSTVHHGGVAECDADDLYIPPTLLLLHAGALDDVVMRDEIFGPILPFMPVDNMDQAIKIINSKPHPLVLYLFSNEGRTFEKFRVATKSGGVVVNDVFVQMSLTSYPFGGVGDSGIGAYHGRKTFECFSHQRSVLIKKQNLEFVNDLRYAPYSDKKLKVIEWVMSKSLKRNDLTAVAVAVVAVVAVVLFWWLW